MAEPVRVLVVDDSRIFRNAVQEALTGVDGIQIAGSEFNGLRALEWLRSHQADVVTLDVEMPEMDGITCLKAIGELVAGGREIGVIMLSALTREGAAATMQALSAGAFDFIAKPSGADPSASLAALRTQLVPRIQGWAQRRRRHPAVHLPRPVPSSPAPPDVRLRPPGTACQAVLIGVSTGGPRALMQMLPSLCRATRLPLLIVQHMPPGFTQSLAESLGRHCSHKVVEAVDGMQVDAGVAYIAPGGRHLLLRRSASGRVEVATNDQPPENGVRPAVDVLFRSAATVYGGACLAVILTGMGSDGTRGLGPLKRAGVPVLVQDEATSVVWGMPGSVVAAGLADQVLPLDQIPEAVARLVR